MKGTLQIQNVSKTYDKTKALDDVTIIVPKGTIHGIIGENGAGKTTLIKAVTGIHTVDEGSVTYDGQEIYENNKIKQKIGYVADQNQYFKGYKLNNLLEFFDKTYDDFSKEKFHEYNKEMGLDLNKKVRQLSKGMQMRLSIMINLALNPDLLVLDEPTSGLDAMAKQKVLEWVVEEVEKRDLTVLISSHHLSELEKLCDAITIIEHGKITHQAGTDELKEEVCRIQVVFKNEPPKDLANWEGVSEVKNIGSIHYIVTTMPYEDMKKRLEQEEIVVVERVTLSLEEAFVCMHKKGDSK